MDQLSLRKSQRSTSKGVIYTTELRQIRPRENRRGLKYHSITDEIKALFIDEVLKKNGTIKAAAEKFDLNFSTAKAILHTFRKEGRVGRKIRRHSRSSCFLKSRKRTKICDTDKSSSSQVQKPESTKIEHEEPKSQPIVAKDSPRKLPEIPQPQIMYYPIISPFYFNQFNPLIYLMNQQHQLQLAASLQQQL